MSKPETQTAPDPRTEAVARALASVCSDGNSDAYAVARDALAAADAVDPVRTECNAAHENWSRIFGRVSRDVAPAGKFGSVRCE